MARLSERLTGLQVGRLTADGMYPDGDGVYLQIKGGIKSWVFRFTSPTRRVERYMGLGRFGEVGLADARRKASAARLLIRDERKDPIDERRTTEQQQRAEVAQRATVKTFGAFADKYVEDMRPSWRNPKHAQQWATTLKVQAAPIRDIPINQVDTAAVLSVLEPIWSRTPETARRIRSRLEIVLDAAKAKSQRKGENPARWRGHLKFMLPKPKRLSRGHHAALDYQKIGEFMEQLRAEEGIAARALEFTILACTRTTETLLAEWTEVNLDERVWIIPAERTKTKLSDHRVPLSAPAIAVLQAMLRVRTSSFLFPGWKKGKPLSNMSMAAVLKRMGNDDVTVHGFRSSFKDWASERTSFPNEVSEMALGHKVADKVEAAYRRGDLFSKRRKLAEEWAKFCATPASNSAAKVIPLKARRSER